MRQTVIDRLSAIYEPGQTYYLTGPSGSGKTTLLCILARLTEPDSGEMTAPSRCSMVFQEDRLCEDYDAVVNVALATGDRAGAEEALGLCAPGRTICGDGQERLRQSMAVYPGEAGGPHGDHSPSFSEF